MTHSSNFIDKISTLKKKDSNLKNITKIQFMQLLSSKASPQLYLCLKKAESFQRFTHILMKSTMILGNISISHYEGHLSQLSL